MRRHLPAGHPVRLGSANVRAARIQLDAPVAVAALRSGLHGTVSVPLPVCIQDQPCSRKSPGVKLSFWRGERVVGSVISGAGGRYQIALAPGGYAATSPAALRPKGSIRQSPVRVVAGTFREVEFLVDTGIRAA